MRILIVRHSDPEYHGDTLTPAGEREAAALAKRFLRGIDGRRPTRLFTSPLGRARDTARWTERALDMEATVENWTRELSDWPRLSGDGDKGAKPGEGGLALWDIKGEVVKELRDLSIESMWAVDGFEEAKARFEELSRLSDEFVGRLGYVREGGRYKVVKRNRDLNVVFCHGGFGLTWLAHLLMAPLPIMYSSFWLPPSSVTTVLFDERSKCYATPRVIGMADTSHMYAEGLTTAISRYEKPNMFGNWERPSGIKANFW